MTVSGVVDGPMAPTVGGSPLSAPGASAQCRLPQRLRFYKRKGNGESAFEQRDGQRILGRSWGYESLVILVWLGHRLAGVFRIKAYQAACLHV